MGKYSNCKIICLWHARRDLNPRHLGSKPSALSTELRAHKNGVDGGTRTLDLLGHNQTC